jgi:GNAT superfamily N-acetyltransferase
MRAEVVDGITIRPLRNGDAETLRSVFERLGPQSRLRRFGGAKNVLLASDIEQLTRVDGNHHVLVAVAAGEPVGIAHLVRDGSTAELGLMVADDWHGRGVGSLLCDRLAEDARAAGIRRIEGAVQDGNHAAAALVRRLRAAVGFPAEGSPRPNRLGAWRTQSG